MGECTARHGAAAVGQEVGLQAVEPGWRIAVLVCCNERAPAHRRGSCGRAAGERLVAALRDRTAEAGIRRELVVQRSGCLNVCGAGTTVALVGDLQRTVWTIAPRDEDALWGQIERAVTGRETEAPNEPERAGRDADQGAGSEDDRGA